MTFEHSEHVLDKATLILEETVNPAFQLSESLVHNLLDKLSSADDFRALFQRSPREALASLGHEAAANASDSDKGIWACLRCDTLASAETIGKSRDQLRIQLLIESAQFNPVALAIAPPQRQ